MYKITTSYSCIYVMLNFNPSFVNKCLKSFHSFWTWIETEKIPGCIYYFTQVGWASCRHHRTTETLHASIPETVTWSLSNKGETCEEQSRIKKGFRAWGWHAMLDWGIKYMTPTRFSRITFMRSKSVFLLKYIWHQSSPKHL